MELKYYVIDLTEGSLRLESQTPWNPTSGVMPYAKIPHPDLRELFLDSHWTQGAKMLGYYR